MGSANRQRQRRKLLAVAGFLATGILIATVLLTTHKQLPLQADAEAVDFDISSFVNARRLINYEQPSAELIEKISKVYDVSAKGESQISDSSNNPSFVIIDGVPFHTYWQGGTKRYAFHPMGLGGFLGSLDCDAVKRYINAAVGMDHELPNGGLLWRL